MVHNLHMESRMLVGVEEYLSTDYSPDRDYVDGELWERNVGEKDHSKIQVRLAALLFQRRRELGIHVFTEQRVRVSGARFRVPDLCVVAGPEPEEQVFTSPPFLCVEILSPEDRASRVQEKLADYLAFGVGFVWVIDPQSRRAFAYTRGGMVEAVTALRTSEPEITVELHELWAD